MKGYNKNRQKFNVQLSDGTNNISFEQMWALNQASKSPGFTSNPLAKAYTPSFGIGGIISKLAPVAAAIPGVGTLAAAGIGAAGSFAQMLDKPTQANPSVGYANRNTYGMATGGSMEPISPNAMEVTGAPNQTDGNQINYKGQPINVDHGEVIDHSKDIVFSDKLFDPRSGKSFADTVKPMEKLIGKLSKRPSVLNNNTIAALEKQKQKVFQTQEQVATALGQRNSDGSTVQPGQPAMASGGKINSYSKGGDLLSLMRQRDNEKDILKRMILDEKIREIQTKTQQPPDHSKAPKFNTDVVTKNSKAVENKDSKLNPKYNTTLKFNPKKYEQSNYSINNPETNSYKPKPIPKNDSYGNKIQNIVVENTAVNNQYRSKSKVLGSKKQPTNKAIEPDIQPLKPRDFSNSNYTPPTQSSKNYVTTGSNNFPIVNMVQQSNTQTTLPNNPQKNNLKIPGVRVPNNTKSQTSRIINNPTSTNEFKYSKGYEDYASLDLRPDDFNQYVDAFLQSDEGQKYQRIQRATNPNWSFWGKNQAANNTIGPKYAALINNPEFQKMYKTPQLASQAATGKGSPFKDPTSVFQNAPGFAATNFSTNKYSKPDYADDAKNTFDQERERSRLAGTTDDNSEENKRPGSEPFDAAGNIDKFFKEHPNPVDPKKKPSKYGLGDYLQLGAAGASILGALFDRPEKQRPNLDRTQITENKYDPANALMQNQYTTNAAMMANANNYSSAGIQAGLQNLMANKYRADAQVATQYDQMNQQARTQYEQRLQQQNQFNAQVLNANDDKNVANRAAYTNNLYGALKTVSQVGSGLNDKSAMDKYLEILAKKDPQASAGILDPATGQFIQGPNNIPSQKVYQQINGKLYYEDGTEYKPKNNWSGGKIKFRKRR